MLDEFVKTKKKELKSFNVNMQGSIRTLHVNGDLVGKGKTKFFSPSGNMLPYKRCPYQSYDKFIPFNSIAEVEAFEKAHTCSFRRCGFCFPPDMRGN